MKMINILLQSCTDSISNFLTAPYTGWFPFAEIAALMIISVLAIVYMLAPLVGREDIRRNIKISIYQTLFAIVLILAFGIFATWLCSFDAESLLQSANLFYGVSGAPSHANLYETALYDIYYFTNQGPLANANNALFLVFWLINNGVEGSIKVTVPGISSLGIGDKISFSLSGPIGALTSYATTGLSWLFIMNDLQFILISASPIIFAIFLSIGLIARIFGISRNFGGGLIALGLGIGFVYPLMVSITYGFINTSYATLQGSLFADVISNALGTEIQSQILNLLSGNAVSNILLSYIYSEVNLFGFTFTAALILPILNLVVVETFVIDFSGAFGERMSFMSLLASIV
ncbi:MAG: hypothetical protein ACP5JN_02185 [Candidatus Micrarchaeia archaeon]